LSPQPVMNSLIRLFCADWRMNGPLHGQWSTGLGILGMVLHPHIGTDVTHNYVIGCQLQCYSVFYYKKFHFISRLFAIFQYSTNFLQILLAYSYSVVMRVLAISGFTLLFFDSESFKHGQHQSSDQNFSVIISRWEWFTGQVKYVGPHQNFPCRFDELPGVPRCYSFDWMSQAKHVLQLRMLLTLSMIMLIWFYFQFNLNISALGGLI